MPSLASSQVAAVSLLRLFAHLRSTSAALQVGSIYVPSRRQRGRRSLLCRAAGGGQPWRFDDLTAASSPGLTSFDDLWDEQMRAMQRAQDRMELQRREVRADCFAPACQHLAFLRVAAAHFACWGSTHALDKHASPAS